ncbi:MAG: hypothetical protein AB1391_03040 [Candidatus Micrarchaeota archaeon]
MPYGLISLQEELRLFARLMNFYSKLYPQIKFTKKEKTLCASEIGEIQYTYAGQETEDRAIDIMNEINDALPEYSVPIVLLKKKKYFLLLDGHRRARVAWTKKMKWKALLIVPNKDAKFGVEDTIMKKIKNI